MFKKPSKSLPKAFHFLKKPSKQKTLNNFKGILNKRIELIMVETETTILNISGSFYVRIPSTFAEHFKLKNKTKAKISDTSPNEAKIKFPVW